MNSFLSSLNTTALRGLSSARLRRLFVKGLSTVAELELFEASPTAVLISRRITPPSHYEVCPVCQHRLLPRYLYEHTLNHAEPFDPSSVVIVVRIGAPEPRWEKD